MNNERHVKPTKALDERFSQICNLKPTFLLHFQKILMCQVPFKLHLSRRVFITSNLDFACTPSLPPVLRDLETLVLPDHQISSSELPIRRRCAGLEGSLVSWIRDCTGFSQEPEAGAVRTRIRLSWTHRSKSTSPPWHCSRCSSTVCFVAVIGLFIFLNI